ncbi:hypothetical protein BH09ACT12_BH09ACT12_03650 [soil metagenome]
MTRNATSRLAVLVAAVALLLGALSAPAALAASPSSARAGGAGAPVQHQGKDVAYFDLYYNPEVAPKRIFFYANSGPYLRGMHWNNWGTKKTVGRGIYVSTCASCAPPKRRKAVVRFSGLQYCKAQDVFYYKRAKMTRKPSEGQTRTVKISAGTCGKRN